jgi:phage repressor protein C with HTH and peptisase S24 domain
VSRRYFPILGSAGAAIFPVVSAEAIPEDYAEFSEDLYRSDVDRFAVIVNGDSMEPRLKSGDVILIHPATTCPSGRMVVFRTVDHEYAVKVLRRDAKGDRFEPINPEYDAIEPRPDWQLVGFVVGWRRDSGRKKYIEEGDNSGLGPEVPF